MKSLKLLLVFLISCLAINVSAHNFIGMHKNDITVLMQKEYKYFKLNTETVNNTYNYLKYEDKVHEMTMLFFLTDENQCKMVRMMCDYSNINDVLSDLDSKYKKTGKGSWVCESGGESIEVILEESDWFFTVTTTKKK